MIKPAPVERDSTGQWFHPDFPKDDDDCGVIAQDVWEAFLDHHSIQIDTRPAPQGQPIESWEPHHNNPEAVLVGISKFETGPVAWFALPAPSWHDRGGA